MLSIIFNKFIRALFLLAPLFYIQGCAVLTPSQVSSVGDFALAAENYTDLPSSVMNLHTHAMLAENIYAAASLSDSGSTADKIGKDVNEFLLSLKTSAKADAALTVIDRYVKLLSKLSSNDFTVRLEEESVILAAEIDGGVSQYNAASGDNIDGFGVAVAEIVRAGGGMIIRYKQAKSLKEAVNSAEPVMQKMSTSVVELMDLYICGVVDEQGKCVIPGFGEMVETGLVDEYQGLLNSGKGNNSVKDIQSFNDMLLKAKSIKPLAEKTKQAMLTFQAAHTKLYDKLQESQTLVGTIEEINVLYGEVKSAQQFRNTIESQN